MRGVRRLVTLAVITTSFLLGSLIAPAAASAGGSIDVLLSDLSSPKGLALNPDGDLAIGQGTFGPPAPILQYILRGRDRGSAVPLTEPLNVVDVAVGADRSGWALLQGGDLVRHSPEGGDDFVVNIVDYQQTNPDPYDVEGNPTESNPYGLAVLPSGDALVVDAAMNNLLRVTPEGDVTTVARFDVEEVSTDHLPPEFGDFPPTMDAESVPTAVTLGADGWVYVGELKGFPFRPGTSHVWSVDPEAEDAVCSVNTPDPDCDIAWSGFTGIQDIAYERRTGTLYVLELSKGGVLAFENEENFESGNFPPAVLIEVKKNKRTELAAGKLSEPGGIVVVNRGNVYVTDGLFTGGRLVEIHR